jgi:uncharacterized membrane protein YkgB
VRGASWFLGVSEWVFCALLFAGFWNRKLGILGALGSVASFVSTVTIIPFVPDGWAASAGGFPAKTGNIPFLMKDVVLLAVSFYLLKQDVMRVSLSAKRVAPDWLERVGSNVNTLHEKVSQVTLRSEFNVRFSRFPRRR